MQTIFDSISTQLQRSDGEVRRLFHGRGRCYPGFEAVVIDLLPPVAVIRLFAEVGAEVVSRLNTYFSALDENIRPLSLVVQHRYRREDSIEVLWDQVEGGLPDSLAVRELGLKYRVKPLKNQNSGLFLDMREGRRWVKAHSTEKNVLNLFAYTCGFSIAAIAGGANKVINLDMSRGALNTGRDNHRLNDHPMERIKFLGHDLFRSWGKLKREGLYDLVVIDPPSFQKGSFVATSDYRKVLRRLPEITNPGAQVLTCLNAPQLESNFLHELMQECCPEFTFIKRIENPEDFPDADPEQALKVLLFARG
ncbi:MAG: class I SAM-dependent methyltransferase [Amphritea sp.]